MGNLKYFLPFVIFFGLLDLITGECQLTQWVNKKQAELYGCSFFTGDQKPKTLYKDVMPNGSTHYYCCSTDTPQTRLDEIGKRKEHCFRSKCTSEKYDDYCPTRHVDDQTYTFDEIFREPCTDDYSKTGLSGLCCGKKSLEGQLAAAYGAETNEFPFIARVTAWYNCGGTIYNEKYIITAAHCVVHKETNEIISPEKIVVSIGSNFGETHNPFKMYKYEVERVIPNGNYSKLLPGREKYGDKILWDVALLELKTPITFGPTVKSLQIAPVGFEPKNYADRVVIAGWGTTDTFKQSPHLQRTDLLLRDPNRCFAATGGAYPQLDGWGDQLLCVGGILDGKWNPIAGEGDSGGPAICRGPDGTAIHCGVTSFGQAAEPCQAQQNEATCTPSVYARVSFFRDWIEEKAGGQDKSTFFKASLYGEHVPTGKYEHQVHITSDKGKSCGGTLIAPDIVVTAGMCVANDNSEPWSGLQVHYGEKDLTQLPTKTFNAQKVTILDGFKRIGKPVNLKSQGNRIRVTDNSYEKNLALIKLDGNATISPINLARLPEKGEVFVEGKELALPRNMDFNIKMVLNEFKILDKRICQNRMTRLLQEDEKMGGVSTVVSEDILCGVEKFSGGSRCDRELGGGLICKGKNGKDVLCGVQVFRLCEMSVANAFMDISKQVDWIRLNRLNM